MIDLHSHSSASDGTLSPSALVDLAAERRLAALALTDHDTVAGLEEAGMRAAEKGLRLVRGVEIEIAFMPGEFHLLGLDLGAVSPELAGALAGLARSREERNRRIVWRLRNEGIGIDYDELVAASGSSCMGRAHIAKRLVELKVVRTKQAAFDRYLAKGRPMYEAKDCLELAAAVDLIGKSGGLSFVAHPLSLFVSWTRLRELFAAWRELGVDGIEAWHPTAKRGHCERLERMGVEFGFRIAAGSDFHGVSRPDRMLGRTAGDLDISDRYLAAIER
ncbi:MAG: PHP domain-containing protein [Spirochaetes bacterium]|nr:PHP domain-containing protein [Spirochaetota bacterium]